MFVSVGQKNSRTNFRISAPSEFIKQDREPTKWTLEYANKKFKVISSYATADSDFVSLGQKVFMIIFKNGVKFRWESGMITEKELRAIKRVTNLKGRPHDRVYE